MTGFAVDGFPEAFDHAGLLVRSEECPFPGMAEDDQAFHAVEAAEPGAQTLDCRVVDLTVARERGHRRGDEPSQIKRCHVVSSDAI